MLNSCKMITLMMMMIMMSKYTVVSEGRQCINFDMIVCCVSMDSLQYI